MGSWFDLTSKGPTPRSWVALCVLEYVRVAEGRVPEIHEIVHAMCTTWSAFEFHFNYLVI